MEFFVGAAASARAASADCANGVEEESDATVIAPGDVPPETAASAFARFVCIGTAADCESLCGLAASVPAPLAIVANCIAPITVPTCGIAEAAMVFAEGIGDMEPADFAVGPASTAPGTFVSPVVAESIVGAVVV